jgi:Na+-driven multidrug efflux pump
MALHLLRPGAPVQLHQPQFQLRADLLRDILRVGLPASLNPVLSNACIAIATALVARFGTAALAGYGVAARLEYILVPIAFGFGIALNAMVATNMGAGHSQRALRVTWTGAAVVAAITGSIGLAAAIAPWLWMDLFSSDTAVVGLGSNYLNIAGGTYGFFGLGLALLFASQGAGRMAWPIVASTSRLLVVALGGWVAVVLLKLPATVFFFVVAASLAVYGITLAAAIRLGGWTR